ncbi:tetratricopeptide repeat protein [Streptomyces coelicoflavus]|uniref:Tetratricopeptide repeat protein n=1 Tax=Streptomyces coelicoflavus TaxID=285562 RepID=A0A7K3PSS3_9ACTN|nr:FxSxx-COOH system tetratricopeptide repeat protein [Streptomyces coelicoflavus]NEB12381.1 tetratricopeptide repeat protein [Streptomyces coelicoflavus]
MDDRARERAPESGGTGPGTETVPGASTARWQELADALWLSAHWAGSGRPAPADLPAPDGEEPAAPPPTEPSSAAQHGAEQPPDESAAAPQPLYTPHPQGSERVLLRSPALPRGRAAGPGRNGLSAGLARALHRLARQVPSREAVLLDEEETAERGVVDELWMPAFRPAETKAFDLVLLIDDAPTMAIWDGRTASLTAAAEYSGAFRAVRTARIVVPAVGEPALRWNAARATADPGELFVGRGDRIFLLVTDGLGHGWSAPAADRLLSRLGRSGPTAVVHLLPPHARHHSSLRPYNARLEAGGCGAANHRMRLHPPTGGADPLRPLPEVGGDAVPVPVLSLKAASVAAWADLVVAERGVRRALPAVVAGTLRHGAPAPGLRAPRHRDAAISAVRGFLSRATPVAGRLATRLAAAPFRFDLIDQLRRSTMPDAGPEHLAEILMGGLVDWGDGKAEPEFADGVREALLATTTRAQLADVVGILGGLPSAGEHGVALRAALRDPHDTALPDEEADAQGWRQSELAVMRALAGPYSERARRIAARTGTAPGHGSGRPSRPLGGVAPGGAGSLIAVPDGAPTQPSDQTQQSTRKRPGMKSESPNTPALLVNVPLRNTSFVGRQALLRSVEEQLRAQDTAAVLPHALHGRGGVGKSQLVLEYIYTHQHEYNVICWIPAEREPLILTALATLAAQLGVAPARQADLGAPGARATVPAVLEALRTGTPYDNWLLVFDNAEDIDTVRSYFPHNGPGKVIVTSRNRAWEEVATPLPVNVFERAESVELLQKRSPDLTAEDADLLAEALGDLPLAVEQAGAWRAVTGMPVERYLELLAQRGPEILDVEPAPDYPVSVAAAWDLSLEHIQANNPGARQLLDICASMAPEPIPRSVLRGSRGVSITPEVDPLLRQSLRLNRAVRDLSQFALIKVDPRADTVQMHRLLQTVLLAKLGDEERERMRGAAHQLLSAAKPGPYGSSLEWPAYQALLPHVLASQAVTSSDTWVRDLVADTVWFLYYWGDHQAAADYARQAYDAWRAASGEEDVHVLRMTKSFAFLLRQTGQVPESVPLSAKALDISRRIDVDSEELIDSLCEMADARRYQGRFREARDVSREATELARSQFGSDDPATFRAVHSWGVDLRLCGDFAAALPLDQENARLRDLLFGPASFFTLNTLNGLAVNLRESGDYPGARDFQEDVYHRARTAFGDEHPLTLRIARDLAVCRRRDGALAEGAGLGLETLRRFTGRYGPDHYDSLSTAVNVSVDLRLSGDLDGSRRLTEETLRRYEQRLGADHAFTLLTKASLAATLRAQGALDEAAEQEDDAVRRLTASVGGRHIVTLTAETGRANTAYQRLDFQQAHRIDRATLPLLARTVGENHPLTWSCAANLSLDLRGLGRTAEGDEARREAADGLSQVVRDDHPWLRAALVGRRIECDLAPMPL